MAKKVIKEIIIALLLCLAIILILAILLYEHFPITKTIPNEVSYTTPESVKEELADSEYIDESQIIMTYEVDSTDLNNYENIEDYKPGKANPFSSYETSTTTETSGTNTTSTAGSSSTTEDTNSSNNTVNSTTSNSTSSTNSQNSTSSQNNTTQGNTTTSSGQYFQDKGTK